MSPHASLTLEDWRHSDPERLAAAFASERARWQERLHWDPSFALASVERARAAGTVPGYVARDAAGHILGWTYYVRYDGTLRIGNILGESAPAVDALLDAVLDSPEAKAANEYVCFTFPSSLDVSSAFKTRQFAVDRFAYLTLSLGSPSSFAQAAPQTDPTFRELTVDDAPVLARLLARAYGRNRSAQCFAPSGQLSEWTNYVSQLLRTPACGHFDSTSSLAVADDQGQLRGAILTTRLESDTAHIAQLGVHPSARRQGLAARLMEDAIRRMRAGGCERVTLLVAATNTPALSLYQRFGFQPCDEFLHARRTKITRIDYAD